MKRTISTKIVTVVISVALIVLTAFVSISFCNKKSQSICDSILQSAATQAYSYFSDSDTYWAGVINFGVMSHLAKEFYHNSKGVLDYDLILRSTSGLLYWMVESPERVLARKDALLNGMNILAENVWDYNGYNILYSLFLDLQTGEENKK